MRSPVCGWVWCVGFDVGARVRPTQMLMWLPPSTVSPESCCVWGLSAGGLLHKIASSPRQERGAARSNDGSTNRLIALWWRRRLLSCPKRNASKPLLAEAANNGRQRGISPAKQAGRGKTESVRECPSHRDRRHFVILNAPIPRYSPAVVSTPLQVG